MLRFSAQSSRRLRKAAITTGVVVLATAGLLGLEPTRTYLDPNPFGGGHLGTAVAGFSERVAVGAPYVDHDGHLKAGKVVIYDTPSRLAIRTIHNPDPGDDEDMFGAALAAIGQTTLVVGAPRGNGRVGVVYVFNILTGDRLLTIENPDPDLGDGFGAAVAVVFPDKILVGAPGDDTDGYTAGAAYLFDGATGDLLQTLYADDALPGAEFGAAVAGNADAIVGAPGFDGSGRVYVIDPDDGSVLVRILNPSPGAGNGGKDKFGAAVASEGFNVIVGAPGEDAGVGAPDAGTAYYFDGETGRLLRVLANPDPDADDTFGAALAAKPLNRVVVGAPKDDNEADNAGAAYLFNTSTGAVLQTFSDSASTGDERCGEAVALSDGSSGFVVGCTWADAGRDGSGKALFFQEAPGPEISVHDGYLSVRRGDTTPINIGSAAVGDFKRKSFSILNIGSARLDLTGNPRVAIVSDPRGCFSISTQPAANVASGEVSSFRVQFTPPDRGLCNGTIEIRSNDADEGRFRLNVKGTGT